MAAVVGRNRLGCSGLGDDKARTCRFAWQKGTRHADFEKVSVDGLSRNATDCWVVLILKLVLQLLDLNKTTPVIHASF